MKRFHAVLPGALLALSFRAGAAEVRSYDVRIALDASGAGRGRAALVLSGSPGETFDVPLAPGWQDVRAGETSDGPLLRRPTGEGAILRATVPAAATDSYPATFTFVVPAAFAKRDDGAAGRLTMPLDSRMLRFAFVNTQVTAIRGFRASFVLPEGTRVQTIREALPRPGRSESEPRVRLGADGPFQSATLAIPNLVQGDDTSMQVEVVPARRSPLWLAAGLVLSALYLFKFRDLVASGAGDPKAR